jgi:molybdenum cofactor biosynthesis enzyme MoaA
MSIPLPILDHRAPQVPLAHLDELWFQVTGTLCNLTCRHCFISCGPHNRSFGFLTLERVKQVLEESVSLGVKEYYFTGGEPFLHPDMTAMLVTTLRYGAATVLTNGTVFKDAWLEELAFAEDRSLYSLEFRVSIDGFSAQMNDPVRGAGTFERALAGVAQLLHWGFLPIVTVAHTQDDQEDEALFRSFVELLRSRGYDRPRVKILPALRLGAEAARRRAYLMDERVTLERMEGFDSGLLLCSHARLVSDRGVHVCPILLEAPDGLLGQTLAEAQAPFALRHHACYTCWQHGSICANPSGGAQAGATA